MSGRHPDDSYRSASLFLRLDEICDRFEACLQAEQRPRIEDFLASARESDRPPLLRELLLLDMEYRAKQRDRPTAAEYRERFPDHAELIEDVLGRLGDDLSPDAGDRAESPWQIILEVVGGPHTGRRFVFTGHDGFIVGRAASSHFRLPREDPYFSRIHFVVEVNPPHCRLMDMNSLNGTYVNGREVQADDLHHGDLVKGGETELRVWLVGDTPRPEAVAAALDADGSLPPPAIPGFEIVRELGRGGMGVVYLAKRTADGARLAVKTILPAFAAGQREVQRFLRECEVLCSLRHPHIVAFHQMGRTGNVFYFAMDYVEGTDAGRLVQSHGPMPVGRAVRLACQVLEALDFAHGHGFVHRDVKPANLLIGHGQRGETCRLADFGLARVYHASHMSGLTMLGDVGGTLAFMPPEQITDYRNACPPADLYSTSATLYYLLTGRHVYDFGEDLSEQQLIKILTEPPVPIRNRRDDVPQSLASVIHRALAKDPRERFPEAAAFREALLPFSSAH